MTSRRYVFPALAALDAGFAAGRADRARWVTKPLLMPTLMPGKDRATQRALGLGALGDVALLGSGSGAFTVGLGAFLAGHLAWVAALRPHSARALRRRPLLAAPYLLAWAGLNSYLWPRTGRDRVPVLAYSTALLATALAAADTGRPDLAAGGALFLLSDTLLALERFGELHLPAHEAIVMTTYAGAQGLLARV